MIHPAHPARALGRRAVRPRRVTSAAEPARLPRLALVREARPAYGATRPAAPPTPDGATALAARTLDAPAPAAPAAPAADAADLDALESLGDEIATLAAHIHAATHRLLTLLADFDARRGWERDGHRSCAHWLSFRTGIDLGAAREKVRAARALAGLPETSAAMARGELSFSQVRALTRVATPDDEADLLEIARGCSTAQLERVVRGWRRGSHRDEAARERERHDSRTLSLFHGDDGMVVVRGRLTPEVGALLMRAIEAASDALYRDEAGIERLAERPGRHPAPGDPARGDSAPGTSASEGSARGASGYGDPDSRAPLPGQDTHAAAARRRADALALLAERALAAGFGDGAPVSGSRAARYQVVLHVDEATLAEEGGVYDVLAPDGAEDCGRAEGGVDEGRLAKGRLAEGRLAEVATTAGVRPDPAPQPAPRSHLDDGSHVSAETSRRLSCDTALVRVRHGADGAILDVGRRTRTIPPALRRALEVRDRGCRFPGCGSRFCDAHHVRHWGQGGETSLSNTLLLCAHHHRLVHEGGWRVGWGALGEPVFLDPRGGVHYDARPCAPELPTDPVAALVEAHRERGIEPDWRTAGRRPGRWRLAG